MPACFFLFSFKCTRTPPPSTPAVCSSRSTTSGIHRYCKNKATVAKLIKHGRKTAVVTLRVRSDTTSSRLSISSTFCPSKVCDERHRQGREKPEERGNDERKLVSKIPVGPYPRGWRRRVSSCDLKVQFMYYSTAVHLQA